MTVQPFPLVQVNLTSNKETPQTVYARQGDKGRTQTFVISDMTDAAPEQIGFRSSPGGQFVDVKDVVTRSGDGTLVLAVPDQVFQAAGHVKCYFYIYDGDTVIASSSSFEYINRPEFERGVGGSSYNKTLESLTSEYQAAIAKVSSVVDDTIAGLDVDATVKQQMQSIIDNAQATITKAASDKTATLDTLAKQYQTAVDTAQSKLDELASELTTLKTATSKADTATTAATTATTQAKQAATTATASAKAADTSKANADKAASTATQAATDAGKATSDSKQATADAKAATELAKQAADNANNVSATITDADLAAWITQEAGE